MGREVSIQSHDANDVMMMQCVEEPPYKSGRAAADEVIKAVKQGACVDEHMQDQVRNIYSLEKFFYSPVKFGLVR